MFRAGDMARVGGRLVKICAIESYSAECVWFDHAGRIHSGGFDVGALSPIWVSPKTLWPEISEMPDFLVAELEARAIERRRARYRKPKRSNKLTRG